MKYLRRCLIISLIIVFCQLPVFVDEYSKHLEGHVSEAKRAVEQLQKAAEQSRKTLDEYIEKFEKNDDSDVASQGSIMRGTQNRYEFLKKASLSIRETNIFVRPIIFTWYMDHEIMIETVHSFSPGLLFTKEMVAWGVIGWFLGIVFIRPLSKVKEN